MGILDIVLLVCFIPAIIEGISKGFVKQVISLVSLILGAWAAFQFSSFVSAWLNKYLTIDPKIVNIIAFVIIVILVCLMLSWIGELLTRVIKITALGWLNSILGILFGLAKTALILGLLIMLFESINAKFALVSPEPLNSASVYCMLRDFAYNVFPYLKDFIMGASANPTSISPGANV